MQVSRTLVENNCFEACNGEAEIISNKSCGNIYRGNLFSRCSGALTLRHGNDCVVEDNFFLGGKARGSGGVRIVGRGHRVANNYFADLEGDDTRAAISIMDGVPNSALNGYIAVENAAIADNVFVNCKQTFVVGLGDKDADTRVPPHSVSVTGNVVIARRGPIVDVRDPKSEVAWARNVFAGGTLGVEASAGQWKAADLALGKRNGLEWPESSAAKGPRVDRVSAKDVGPSWRAAE
jgi:poly(beta-D-mannuronate) lyase